MGLDKKLHDALLKIRDEQGSVRVPWTKKELNTIQSAADMGITAMTLFKSGILKNRNYYGISDKMCLANRKKVDNG